MQKGDLKKINDYLWEIPRSYLRDMRVPARFYASDSMLSGVFKDKSLEQLVNLTTLPGIEKYALAMPDVHEGYGSPIGGVFATRVEDGIISPGAVGYDQNCGVRVIISDRTSEEIQPRIDTLAAEIQKIIPSGLGRGHGMKLNKAELDKILESGALELERKGYAVKEDIENCEANGRLNWADPDAVSDTAKNRGLDQVGTLGSGNHFLEIQKVEQVLDPAAAKAFGLFQNQAVIMIHTGSRGVGHQIATDYIRLMLRVMPKYQIELPDRELACAPFNSPEGQKFFRAMACGANFAWANRQMITYYIRQAWAKVFGNRSSVVDRGLRVLYDVAHNIAKIEKGGANTRGRANGIDKCELIVHRKGATRAYPPGHPEIPAKYRAIGQPVLIPGSMGTASYILAGVQSAEQSFYSTCHGAGRRMSRHQAVKTLSGREIVENLAQKGVVVKCYSLRGIAEEAPQAYKNIDEIIEVVHQAGLSKKVARLTPLAVIKGE